MATTVDRGPLLKPDCIALFNALGGKGELIAHHNNLVTRHKSKQLTPGE